MNKLQGEVSELQQLGTQVNGGDTLLEPIKALAARFGQSSSELEAVAQVLLDNMSQSHTGELNRAQSQLQLMEAALADAAADAAEKAAARDIMQGGMLDNMCLLANSVRFTSPVLSPACPLAHCTILLFLVLAA